jgi:hypothetical protein
MIPAPRARIGAFTLVAATLLAVALGAQSPHSDQLDSRGILREALVAARSNDDPADRLRGLMSVVPPLDTLDSDEATRVLDEAARTVPKLTDSHSFWTGLLETFARVPLSGVVFGVGAQMQHEREVALELRDVNGQLALSVVEGMAPRNWGGAFALATAIEHPYSRARALDIVFHASGCSDMTTLTSMAREQQASAKKQRSAVVLAGLASGVAGCLDPMATEFVRDALEILSTDWDRMNQTETAYVCEVVGRLSAAEAETLLDRLIARQSWSRTDALLTFARSVMNDRPALAWQVLVAVQHRDKTRVAALASTLRVVAPRLPPEMRNEIHAYAVGLFPQAEGAAVGDLLVTLAMIDPVDAWLRADRAVFAGRTTIATLMQSGNQDRAKALRANVHRVELALTLLAVDTSASMAVLDTLPREYWDGVTTAIWFGYPRLGYREHRGAYGRLAEQVEQVRREWPAAALRLGTSDRAAAVRSLRRFAQVCEWLDRAAVDRLGTNDERAELLIRYLPFCLSDAAGALAPLDPSAADAAIRTSVALASSLPSPVREWTLCWNAAVWQRIDRDAARGAVAEALEGVRRLEGHGDWWPWAPAFVEQVAHLDQETALELARRVRIEARAAALAAVITAPMRIRRECGAGTGRKCPPQAAPLDQRSRRPELCRKALMLRAANDLS